jgi:polar amino acid transport system substrate-binding protein
MKPWQFLLVIVLSIGAAVATVRYVGHGPSAPAPQETAYDRVLRTGVLRCAYGLWDPVVMRDPKTGQFSGIGYDLLQEVGKSLNLKVEYTLEVPWDSVGVALKTGKVDAHCAGIFATPARGRVMAFSNPMFFSPTVAFARADDNRFDNNPAAMNQPDVTIALSDDDITTEIFDRETPLAKKWNLPQFAPPEELLLALATHKADVTFNSPARIQSFQRGYPGKVKIVPSAKPLRIYPNVIAVDIGDQRLQSMLNTAIDQMIDSGVVDKLVAKYKTQGYDVGFMVPVNRPYTWKQPQ